MMNRSCCSLNIWHIVVLMLIIDSHCYAQAAIDIPFLQNFSKKDYTAATQNWNVLQDKQGVVCFANNAGLLRFNGKDWRVSPLQNHSYLRSIAQDSNGVIYAGGQNELGFFIPSDLGDWIYKSLMPKLPLEEHGFDDVWDILVHETGVYYCSRTRVFRYHQDTFSVYRSSDIFYFVGAINEKPVVAVGGVGLFYLKRDNKMELIQGSEIVTRSPISSILEINDSLTLIASRQNGLFLYHAGQFTPLLTDSSDFFLENEIAAVAKLHDGHLAIATSLAGVVIISPSGKIRYHIDHTKGLLNNRVLCVHVDNSGNIWLGLDNGITMIEYNAPYTQFHPDNQHESFGYSAILYNRTFYFGTASGLYSYPCNFEGDLLSATPIIKVSKSEGQVRNLREVGGILTMGHHMGGFKVKGNQASQITPGPGYWLFQTLVQNPEYVLAGTYFGLKLFRKEMGDLLFLRDIEGFSESSRFVEQDANGSIWVAHPNKGIFRLQLNEVLDSVVVTRYGKKDGLPDDRLNHVFKINNELIFTGSQGIFSFDPKENTFVNNKEYSKVFGQDECIIRLYDQEKEKIWYITNTEVGYIKIEDKSLGKEVERIQFPELGDQMVEGFELIYPFNDQAFIATDKGFVHFNDNRTWIDTAQLQIIFNEIMLTNNGIDSLFYGTFWDGRQVVNQQLENSIPELPYRKNAISFSFSATKFTNPERTQYQHYLEGQESLWSTPINKSEKEYTNLKAGKYTFHVRAIDEKGNSSDPISYSFVIQPAWYASTIAYVIYFLLLVSLLAYVYKIFSMKYDEQKEIVVQSEKLIDQLKEEKLETELVHKNRELLIATLHMVHKNEILTKLKSSIEKQTKVCVDMEVKNNLKAVVGIIDDEEVRDSEWEQFENHFNNLHTGFFKRLRSAYSGLSPRDLKMCAYLRMNLSSKEIATLSNITIRGVEGARYRLRKKMELESDNNLVAFLLGV